MNNFIKELKRLILGLILVLLLPFIIPIFFLYLSIKALKEIPCWFGIHDYEGDQCKRCGHIDID